MAAVGRRTAADAGITKPGRTNGKGIAASAKARKHPLRAYIDDCLQTANWLVRALDQRSKTILKVSAEIVRQQDAFFAPFSGFRGVERPGPNYLLYKRVRVP